MNVRRCVTCSMLHAIVYMLGSRIIRHVFFGMYSTERIAYKRTKLNLSLQHRLLRNAAGT